MKKIITLMMSLLIMTTMMPATIHADDTGIITEDGGSQDVDIASEETVEKDAVTSTDVFRVSISWTTTPACYSRKDGYIWNAETLNYDVFDSRGQATKSSATSSITITNYSNTDIDYDISFTSKKADDKDIATEAKATDSAVEKNGTIASADKVNAIIASGDSNGNSSESVIYKSTISYTDDYAPEDGDNSEVGTYSVAISKAMTLSKYSLSIRVGRTKTLTSNKTVTWSSSDTNVATVNATTGAVTAVAEGTATITATDAYNRSKTCTVIVRPASYFITDSQSDFDLLLATPESEIVSYVNPKSNAAVYAYNGFIQETAYATWYQADSFVKALNDNNIKPVIAEQGTEGTWRLIESESDAYAWATATKTSIGDTSSGYAFTSYDTIFESVNVQWTGAKINTSEYHLFFCRYGNFPYTNNKSLSDKHYGFLVIWQPAN